MTKSVTSKHRFENRTIESLNQFINDYIDKKWYWITSLNDAHPFDRIALEGYREWEQNDPKVQFFGNEKGTTTYLTEHDFKIAQKKLAQIERAKEEILS